MRRFIMSIIFLLSGFFCFAFDWPIGGRNISSTFGSKGYGTFYQGIKLNSRGEKVHPSEKGEIIYYHDESGPFSKLPSGLGSFIIVEHEGELKTVYGHLRKGSVIETPGEVDPAAVLGESGDTGFAYGTTLFFGVIDGELQQLINPLLLLPPFEDKRPPVIKSPTMEFRETDISVADNVVVPSGTCRLTATIYDPSEHVDFFSPMAPYSITVFLGGETITSIEFDALEITNGSLKLPGSSGISYSDFYSEEWVLNLGEIELQPGKTQLEIVARDLGENETSVLYNLNVEKQ